MSWNPDEFSEYREHADAPDYSNPAYYQQNETPTPRSAQPVQQLEPPPTLVAHGQASSASPAMYAYDPGQMSAYRGPSSMEGYTDDAGADQRELAKHGTISDGKKRKKLAGLGGLGATIIGLLVKFKALLVVLFDLKWFAVFSKVGFAGITAIISVAAYSLIFGWPFAIGLVILLFVHEMGHALVMKLKGIPIGGMIFIPLLGAAVFMRQMPKNAKDEAEVGIAGPIAGAIAASVCFFLAQSNPYSIWTPLAYFGFFINLFNLLPIVPFDGGRVLAAIDRRLWIVGFIGLIGFLIWSYIQYHSISIWLLFFIVIAATQLWSRRAAADTPEARSYYKVSTGERITLTLVYFGLAAVLVLGMTISTGLMHSIAR
ncbi:MAG TPA: site-2 protease family protein [Ktedonobacteraceae bacterium]|nr:site-2 protease family protein [Ktedonobacteraceae bacterium]